MKHSSILSVKNLKLVRGGRLILDIPCFEIKAGTTTILSGKNGSGKTSFLKILSGLTKANSGIFKTGDGEISCTVAASKFCGKHLYLHQVAYMFSGTVVDNLAFGLRQRNHSKAIIEKKINATLKWANLEHLKDRDAKKLSTGEQHQIALARARILNPKLLLLDETTAHMDKAARIRTYQLIKDLRQDGVTMMFATHEEESQRELDGAILGIEHGKLL